METEYASVANRIGYGVHRLIPSRTREADIADFDKGILQSLSDSFQVMQEYCMAWIESEEGNCIY